MDKQLFDHLYEQIPYKSNKALLSGVIDEQFKHVLEIIDKKFVSNSRHWPGPDERGVIPLEYVLVKRADPMSAAEHMVKGNAKKDQAKFELKRTRAVMIEIHLRIYGELRIKPVWILYPKNNIFLINDVEYMMSMVLVDDIFSVDKKGIGRVFLKTDLDSISFGRKHYPYLLDYRVVNQTIVYSPLYKNAKAKQERTRRESRIYAECDPLLVHYLCAKEGSGGVTGVFKQYLGIDIAVGTADDVNNTIYPTEQWCIASSCSRKPSGQRFGNLQNWRPNPLRIAYPREADSQFTRDLIAGVFYVTDHYPVLLTPEVLDDPLNWAMALSYLYFPYSLSAQERALQMEQHLKNVLIYLDDDVRDAINEHPEFDITINDFYDVFALMIKHTNRLIDQHQPGCLFGKRVSSVEFILSDFFNKIGNITLSFQKPAKGLGASRIPTKEAITRIVGRCLHRDVAVRELQKNLGLKHKELRQVNTASPCLAIKTTPAMIMQEDVKSGNTRNVDICTVESYYADASVSVIGSLMRQPKYRPDSRAMMNPQVIFDKHYRVLPHPALSLMVKLAQEDIDKQAFVDPYEEYDLQPLDDPTGE